MKTSLLLLVVLVAKLSFAQTNTDLQVPMLSVPLLDTSDGQAIPLLIADPAVSNLNARVQLYREADAVGVSPDMVSSLPEWIAASKSARFDVLPSPIDLTGVRALGEVTTPASSDEADNQAAELAWAKARGYNAALLVWRGEDPSKLAALAARLKVDGWKLLFAYSPIEDARVVSPAQIAAASNAILPSCDAALLAWRSTSGDSFTWYGASHESYAKVLSRIFRAAKPGIPLLGEFYSSETAIKLNSYGTSATLVVNAAQAGIDGAMMQNYLSQRSRPPFLVLVVGAVPYYDTVYAIPGYTLSQAVADKQALETEISSNGMATLTLVGDGYGERVFKGKQRTDSLTRSQLNLLK